MVHLPSRAALAAPFQSKEAFADWIRAPEGVGRNGQKVAVSRWTNADLEPTGPEQRTWTWYNLPLYWGFTVFGPTGWNVASSLIATGLTWQQAFASCIVGAFISALCVMALARPGAVYHI